MQVSPNSQTRSVWRQRCTNCIVSGVLKSVSQPRRAKRIERQIKLILPGHRLCCGKRSLLAISFVGAAFVFLLETHACYPMSTKIRTTLRTRRPRTRAGVGAQLGLGWGPPPGHAWCYQGCGAQQGAPPPLASWVGAPLAPCAMQFVGDAYILAPLPMCPQPPLRSHFGALQHS